MFPLQDANQSRTTPFVNWLLILVNVFVFLLEATMDKPELNAFITHFGIVPARLLNDIGLAQVSTLFSSMFLHAGWLHLISNMWALYIFGDNVEDRLGHVTYLLFYLLCGITGGIVQVYSGPQVTLPTIGASGAIAGVLGAYLILFPQAKIITLIPIGFIPLFIHVPAFVYLGFWFLTQFVSGSMTLDQSHLASEAANVAFWAHVGGFVAGMVLVKFLAKQDYRKFYPDEYWPY